MRLLSHNIGIFPSYNQLFTTFFFQSLLVELFFMIYFLKQKKRYFKILSSSNFLVCRIFQAKMINPLTEILLADITSYCTVLDDVMTSGWGGVQAKDGAVNRTAWKYIDTRESYIGCSERPHHSCCLYLYMLYL